MLIYSYLPSVIDVSIEFLKLYITRKHSVKASNRYVFRYRKIAKEINT
jgi:hypothetical protein